MKCTCLEVVNERLHALLHRCTGWWHEFVVVHLVRTRGHLVQTLYSQASGQPRKKAMPDETYSEAHLMNNAQRLPEFLHTTEISIVAVARLAYWHVKLNLRK